MLKNKINKIQHLIKKKNLSELELIKHTLDTSHGRRRIQ